jgi:hypothetical protein
MHITRLLKASDNTIVKKYWSCPCVSLRYILRRYSGAFLTSTLDGGEWSAQRPVPTEQEAGRAQRRYQRCGEKKILFQPGIEPKFLSRPARGQSLQWILFANHSIIQRLYFLSYFYLLHSFHEHLIPILSYCPFYRYDSTAELLNLWNVYQILHIQITRRGYPRKLH